MYYTFLCLFGMAYSGIDSVASSAFSSSEGAGEGVEEDNGLAVN